VRTHPATGRKAIYITPIRIEEIIGMSDAEALPLLDALLAHATQGAFCLLHKANGDYPVAQVRYPYRLMLKGGRPR
jgi:taurine dioxygenase